MRRLLPHLVLAALLLPAVGLASFGTSGPAGPAGGRQALVLADVLGDDVLDLPGSDRDLDDGARPAAAAKLVRHAASQRPGPWPAAFALTPGVAAPPAPARTGWFAGGTETRAGQLALGIAGIRAPPASSI